MTVAIGNTGLTALQAMATAEGMTQTAKVAEIIRKNENGHSETLLDVQGIIGERDPDVKLQPNDIVFIRDGGKRYEEALAKYGRDPVPEVSPEDLKKSGDSTRSRTQTQIFSKRA
jgi:protein involved in polysaccharide export with SLBB domain